MSCSILTGENVKTLHTLSGQVVETSGAKLLDGGVNELKKHLATLAAGGVLFLDEAYQLNPRTNPTGAQASLPKECPWDAIRMHP